MMVQRLKQKKMSFENESKPRGQSPLALLVRRATWPGSSSAELRGRPPLQNITHRLKQKKMRFENESKSRGRPLRPLLVRRVALLGCSSAARRGRPTGPPRESAPRGRPPRPLLVRPAAWPDPPPPRRAADAFSRRTTRSAGARLEEFSRAAGSSSAELRC